MFLMRVPRTPDAGPDGVDLGVVGGDGDLRAIAGLAGQGADRDDLVGDLGDLQLEEPADEVGMRAAQDDLDPLSHLADIQDDRADSLVGMIALAGDLLAARQDGVGLAEVDDDRPPLEPLHGPGHQVAALILEFVEEAVAFGLADLLDDDLLGRLGGDPAQFGRIHLDAILGRVDRARIRIDADIDLGRLGIMLACGGGEGRLDPFEKNILGDILIAVDAIDNADQIDAHSSPPRRAQDAWPPAGGVLGRIGMTATAGTPSPVGWRGSEKLTAVVSIRSRR